MSDLNFDSVFGDSDFEMRCPACDHEFTVKLSEVATEGNLLDCPGCNKTIRIELDDETKANLEKLDEDIQDIPDRLRRIYGTD